MKLDNLSPGILKMAQAKYIELDDRFKSYLRNA